MKLRHAIAAENVRVMTRGDGTEVVAGYASVFGNKNRHGEIFRRGAFATSLSDPDERARICHLIHHDSRMALGVPDVLEEQKRGFYFETVPLETPTAQAAMTEIRAGALRGVSIGFDIRNPEGYTWVEKKSGGYIEVTDVILWEYSAVRWGSDSKALAGVAMRADDLHPARRDRASALGLDLRELLAARYHLDATDVERCALDQVLAALMTSYPIAAAESAPAPAETTEDALAEALRHLARAAGHRQPANEDAPEPGDLLKRVKNIIASAH